MIRRRSKINIYTSNLIFFISNFNYFFKFKIILKMSFQVLSILHEISTDSSYNVKKFGALVFAKVDNDYVIMWREYMKYDQISIKNAKLAKTEIMLKMSNIQKIMLNHQKNEPYILITSINPFGMHQFGFPPNSSYQLVTFAQTLSMTLKKLPETTNITFDDAMEFILESYSSNKEHYHLFEITNINNEIQVSPEFTMNGITSQYEFVMPDLHIISKFGVKGADYMDNPLTLDELNEIKTLDELKRTIRKRGITPSIRNIVWPLIFNVIPFEKDKREDILKARISEYETIKAQWKSISRTQLKYFTQLSDAFAIIRVDVKRTHPPSILSDIPEWSEILTSILRTFVFWNLDVRYTQGLNDIAVNIMISFIPTNMNRREAEALSFWCFASFVEKISSGLISDNLMDLQSKELTQVMVIIDKYHPGCSKWLRTNGFSDLTFLISSFILAYGRSFTKETISRLWETFVCVDYPYIFLRYFSATLMIFSFPTLQKIQNCSIGKLVSLLDTIFVKQEIGPIIGVSLAIMQEEHIDLKSIGNHEESFIQTGMFKPVEKFMNCYFRIIR